MNRVLCSTGALLGRPNGRRFQLLHKLAPLINCDGFEFMMYDSWYDRADELLSVLKSLGVLFPVMHFEKHIGEFVTKGEFSEAQRRFELNCRIANEIGADKAVLHLWNGIISDSNFENSLKGYGILRKTAEKYGIDLLVENVVCHEKDPITRWQQLVDKYPDAGLIYDTKMAAFHGQDEIFCGESCQRLWQNVRHLHVNDYGGGYMEWQALKTLPVGMGHIDFDKFFEKLKSVGYTGCFTAEATAFDQNGMVDTALLNDCLDKIRSYLDRS